MVQSLEFMVIFTLVSSWVMPHSYPIDNTATQQEHSTMYTVQYRFKENAGTRYSKWFKVSQHETVREARDALGQHIVEFPSFNARLITSEGKTLGEYKYTDLY